MKKLTWIFVVTILAWQIEAHGPPWRKNGTGIPDLKILKGSSVIVDYTNYWEDEDLMAGGFLGCYPKTNNSKVRVTAGVKEITFEADPNWTGTARVIIQFCDDEMFDAFDTVLVSVTSNMTVLTGPYVKKSIPDTALSSQGTLSLSLSDIFGSKDQSPLTYLVQASDSKVKHTVTASSMLMLTPSEGWKGNATITVKATNSLGFAVPDTFVLASTQAGVFTPLGDRSPTGLFPVRFRRISPRSVCVDFAQTPACLRIFDIHGRLVHTAQVNVPETIRWKAPRGGSGVYLLLVPGFEQYANRMTVY